MTDVVNVGNEIRRQYMPKHVQMPEARNSDEVLFFWDYNFKIAVVSGNTRAIVESDGVTKMLTTQPLRNV